MRLWELHELFLQSFEYKTGLFSSHTLLSFMVLDDPPDPYSLNLLLCFLGPREYIVTLSPNHTSLGTGPFKTNERYICKHPPFHTCTQSHL